MSPTPSLRRRLLRLSFLFLLLLFLCLLLRRLLLLCFLLLLLLLWLLLRRLKQCLSNQPAVMESRSAGSRVTQVHPARSLKFLPTLRAFQQEAQLAFNLLLAKPRAGSGMGQSYRTARRSRRSEVKVRKFF
jgi:hypothetical protein